MRKMVVITRADAEDIRTGGTTESGCNEYRDAGDNYERGRIGYSYK